MEGKIQSFGELMARDLENNLNILQPKIKFEWNLKGNTYLCPVELLTKPLSYQQFW